MLPSGVFAELVAFSFWFPLSLTFDELDFSFSEPLAPDLPPLWGVLVLDLLAALTVSCLDLLAVVDGVSCLDLDLGVLLLTSLDLADGFSVSTDLPVLLLDGAADLLLVVSSAFPADFEVPSFKLSLPLDFCPDLAVASFDLLQKEPHHWYH